MSKRQNDILNNKLYEFFTNPISSKHKQYEAIRAIIVDGLSANEVAKKYGYTVSSVYTFVRDAKSGKLEFFPKIKKGPKQKRTRPEIQKQIVDHRKSGKSVADIHQILADTGINISKKTIERILKENGFPKLKRRTNIELRRSKNNTIIPDRSEILDFNKLKPFDVDCPTVGIFFFIPYIIESGILDIVNKCELPESSDISSTQANLSMLLFKLIGGKRLSHMKAYNKEPGLGVFAGLNVLPKSTYMGTYSCRCSEDQLIQLQKKLLQRLKTRYPDLYSGDYINLDFHSIPHYGEQSEMEKVWCGARGKTLKGANTVFAQDAQSCAVIYTRSDILRKEEADEVNKFVSYWKEIKGCDINETLVFDCKFTKYEILDELENEKIKFITLRKRNAKLTSKTAKIPKEEWKKVELSIPKRKYNKVSIYEENVKLSKCKNIFRQIVVKDNGRNLPTYIITNDKELSHKKILEVYAKRWRVENKLAELIAFFNLNALSSPIMIRIQFDLLWTIIADTLYHLLAKDLRRFESELAPNLFLKFIDMQGRVISELLTCSF
jgi:transposase